MIKDRAMLTNKMGKDMAIWDYEETCLLYPGIFVLHNEWIVYFRYELHLHTEEYILR